MNTKSLANRFDQIASILTITLGSSLLQSGIMTQPSFAQLEVSDGAGDLQAIEPVRLPQNQQGNLEIPPRGGAYSETETQPLLPESFKTDSEQFPTWSGFQLGKIRLGACEMQQAALCIQTPVD